MARRHVVQYFLELENTYIETKETLDELQELAQAGKVEEETYLDVKKDFEVIKANYDRIAYILFLLNKPNKKNKKEDEVSKTWYDYLKTSSREAIVDESKDALAHIKETIREVKKNATK